MGRCCNKLQNVLQLLFILDHEPQNPCRGLQAAPWGSSRGEDGFDLQRGQAASGCPATSKLCPTSPRLHWLLGTTQGMRLSPSLSLLLTHEAQDIPLCTLSQTHFSLGVSAAPGLALSPRGVPHLLPQAGSLPRKRQKKKTQSRAGESRRAKCRDLGPVPSLVPSRAGREPAASSHARPTPLPPCLLPLPPPGLSPGGNAGSGHCSCTFGDAQGPPWRFLP